MVGYFANVRDNIPQAQVFYRKVGACRGQGIKLDFSSDMSKLALAWKIFDASGKLLRLRLECERRDLYASKRARIASGI